MNYLRPRSLPILTDLFLPIFWKRSDRSGQEIFAFGLFRLLKFAAPLSQIPTYTYYLLHNYYTVARQAPPVPTPTRANKKLLGMVHTHTHTHTQREATQLSKRCTISFVLKPCSTTTYIGFDELPIRKHFSAFMNRGSSTQDSLTSPSFSSFSHPSSFSRFRICASHARTLRTEERERTPGRCQKALVEPIFRN